MSGCPESIVCTLRPFLEKNRINRVLKTSTHFFVNLDHKAVISHLYPIIYFVVIRMVAEQTDGGSLNPQSEVTKRSVSEPVKAAYFQVWTKRLLSDFHCSKLFKTCYVKATDLHKDKTDNITITAFSMKDRSFWHSLSSGSD